MPGVIYAEYLFPITHHHLKAWLGAYHNNVSDVIVIQISIIPKIMVSLFVHLCPDSLFVIRKIMDSKRILIDQKRANKIKENIFKTLKICKIFF
jgi:hypothetical protein